MRTWQCGGSSRGADELKEGPVRLRELAPPGNSEPGTPK